MKIFVLIRIIPQEEKVVKKNVKGDKKIDFLTENLFFSFLSYNEIVFVSEVIISSISAGETINDFIGKCLLFPVIK